MGESLTQRRRVEDEGLRIVNSCQMERKACSLTKTSMTVPSEQAPANFVPAAAVIRRVRALFEITGREGCVDGMLSLLLKTLA